MRSTAVIAFLSLLTAFSTPTRAQDVDCRKDLEKALELIDNRWSFKLFKPGAFDLEGTYKRLEPHAKRAKTLEECADVLARFMARLNDGHSSLQHYPGLDLSRPRMIVKSQREQLSRVPGEDPPVHVYVVARDTTDESVKDIPVGSEIEEVNGKPMQEHYEYVRDRVSGSTHQWRDYITDRRLLEGHAGSEIQITYKTPVRVRKSGTLVRPAAEEAREWFREHTREWRSTYSKRLEGGWGYIRFHDFSQGRSDDTIERFDQALDSVFDAPGIIVDLRENGGGYVSVMTATAGRFIPERATIEYFQVREPGQQTIARVFASSGFTERPPVRASPREEVYEGPLVILIDRGCFSACEGFTAGLQDLNRALVIGTSATGGGSGMVGGLRLPSDAVISFSWSVGWRVTGRQIETNGVAPDIRVRERPTDWIYGRDRALMRAIKALENGEAPTVADFQPVEES